MFVLANLAFVFGNIIWDKPVTSLGTMLGFGFVLAGIIWDNMLRLF